MTDTTTIPHVRRNLQTIEGGGRIPAREVPPRTVEECLEDGKTYKPAAVAAIREARGTKLWRGELDERKTKFQALHEALCDVYGITTSLAFGDVHRDVDSDDSSYHPVTNTITLRGRLSVVTYLRMFAHATGYGVRGAAVWSINAFRRWFPLSFANCDHCDGAILRKRGR